MSNIQKTKPSEFKPENLIFSDPQKYEYGSITYHRINIKTTYKDGSVGDLIIPTEELYTKGVQEVRPMNQENAPVSDYKLPLAMFSMNGATEKEKQWLKTFETIKEKAKEHVIAVQSKAGLRGLRKDQVEDFTNSCFWWGEESDGTPYSTPYLYPKLIVSKKKGAVKDIKTEFYHQDTGKKMELEELIGNPGFTHAAIRFESIYIGGKKSISLQMKVFLATFRPKETSKKNLLSTLLPESEMGKNKNLLDVDSEEEETEDYIPIDVA